MLGASTVQLCTAVMVKGYGLLSETLQGMSDFLDRKGYSSVREIIGTANPYVLPYSEIAAKPRESYRVDAEKCVQCGDCLEACFYDAIVWGGDGPEITEECVGCSFCRSFCPESAIISCSDF